MTTPLTTSSRTSADPDHLCWIVTDRGEFRSRVARYAHDAVRAHERLILAGDGDPDEMRAEITALGDGMADALAAGHAEALSLAGSQQGNGDDQTVDIDAAVASLRSATSRALAAGYRGCRVIVDSTSLARRIAQPDLRAALEFRLGQQAAAMPLGVLCTYQLTELDPTAVTELACLHPSSPDVATPFRLYAGAGVTFVLAGEVDLAGHELFTATLRRVLPLADGPKLIVDGRYLRYIGHQALIALDQQAAEAGQTVQLRGAPEIVARVVGQLALSCLDVSV